MLTEFMGVGAVIVAVIGVLEVSAWRSRRPRRDPDSVSLVRAAMLGDEAEAVRAEFRRSGICPPERGVVRGFPC